jgi:hypothetical protein
MIRDGRSAARPWVRRVPTLGLAVVGLLGPALALRVSGADGRLVPDVAALARQQQIALPDPPAWNASPQTPLCSIGELVAELNRICAGHPQVVHQAQSFVRPDHRWLEAYVKWFVRLNRPLHLAFSDDSFDCDKFSRCFVAFADLLAMKAGERRASVCVGWVSVNNDEAFGGVEAGGGHALVIASTNEGIFMIEPQTGAMTPLARYPNRNNLRKVNL